MASTTAAKIVPAASTTTPISSVTPDKPPAATNELPLMALWLVAGLVVTAAVGKLTLLDPVKVLDEGLFDLVVPALQGLPGLVSACGRLTDLGAIPVNYGMAVALAGVAYLQLASERLRAILAAAVVFGAMVGAHAFQNATNRLVEGTIPAEHVVGAAGPYFSGGVMRVVLLVGMACLLIRPKHAWRFALAAGVFEAFTRLVLGRHWPLDLIAGLAVGLGLLWIAGRALDLVTTGFPTTRGAQGSRDARQGRGNMRRRNGSPMPLDTAADSV